MKTKPLITAAAICSLSAAWVCESVAQTNPELPPPGTPVSSPVPPSSPASDATPRGPDLSEPPKPGVPESKGDEKPKEEAIPLAGYRNGLLYIRDSKDLFILYPSARIQADQYNYFGPGVSDTSLKRTFAFRRVELELGGEFYTRWQWKIEAVFGNTALDNTSGRATETTAAAPGVAPSATSGQYASAQTARLTATTGNVFLNYHADSLLNLQIGQTQMPFSSENQTSSKYNPFMEKALANRVLGPVVANGFDTGVTVWGTTENRFFTYGVAFGNGSGTARVSPDGRGDLMGRVYFRPLVDRKDIGVLKDAQIGASAMYGSRDPVWSYYDYNSMTTQGLFTFWSPVYTNASIGRRVHVLPANGQKAFAGEIRVPFSMFDIASEVVYVDNGTREAAEGYQSQNPNTAAGTLGYGHMHGLGYHVTASAWVFGPRDAGGAQGVWAPQHADFKKPNAVPTSSVQIVARWEQVRLTYDGYDKGNATTATGAAAFTGVGPYDGKIKVDALSLGVNYFFTKNIRLTAQGTRYNFPDSAPTSASFPGGPVCSAASCANRAAAPAQSLPAPKAGTTTSPGDRDNGHSLYEVLFRAQLGF